MRVYLSWTSLSLGSIGAATTTATTSEGLAAVDSSVPTAKSTAATAKERLMATAKSSAKATRRANVVERLH